MPRHGRLGAGRDGHLDPVETRFPHGLSHCYLSGLDVYAHHNGLHFLASGAVEQPAKGEMLIRSRFLSVDPAMRGWVSAVANYSEPVALGAVMRSIAVGEVIASRHPDYAEGFAMECAAMKRVRDVMGLNNVKLMIPFCRRVEEGEQIITTMAEHGLRRGDNGLEIYVMCEIPNNVIQIDAFARIFDGFSIGSNDLTQLTLGVDRDSEVVSFEFDERDPGVKEMIRLAVEGCKRNGCHSGLCGQAPSDYPEMAEFLVGIGIDSMSLNPDVVLKTTRRILEVEQQLGRPPREAGG